MPYFSLQVAGVDPDLAVALLDQSGIARRVGRHGYASKFGEEADTLTAILVGLDEAHARKRVEDGLPGRFQVRGVEPVDDPDESDDPEPEDPQRSSRVLSHRCPS